MVRFLHTADWQIGKPFQSIQDSSKREALRKQRIDTIRGFKSYIDEKKIDFVLVSGDLFDSFTPDKATVSALCSAMGSLEIPIYAIPGNHDHGGPGCIWEQDFFRKEQRELAPNFHILTEPTPLVVDSAVLLPCPLLRRQESSDPTAWLRTIPSDIPEHLPRIVLAHGSTQGFSSSGESDQDAALNQIDLAKLPQDAYDYIALGDWHGCKEVSSIAYYPGTPEQDRFAKGKQNLPGHILVVEIPDRGKEALVEKIYTGSIHWHSLGTITLNGDADLESFHHRMNELLANRTSQDLLQIQLDGALSFNGKDQLDELIERMHARLLDLRLEEHIHLEPSEAELSALRKRDDPLIVAVANSLYQSSIQQDSEESELAQAALRELHLQLNDLRSG